MIKYFLCRYFGLAGMETIKNEPSLALTDDTANTPVEDSFNERQENTTTESQVMDSQGSTSSREECVNSNDQDVEFQESGYVSSNETMENSSPTDKCFDRQVLPTNSPPLHTHSPPLSNFPPLPKFPTTPTSRKNTKQKTMKRKSICSQMSLDMFAFKKNRVATEDSKTEEITTSPKRTVLADRSPPNCELDKKYNESQDDEIGDENKKENYSHFLKDSQNEDMSYVTQEKSKVTLLNSEFGSCSHVFILFVYNAG